MREEFDVPLASFTTCRVGGAARRLVTAETTDELTRTVAEADGRGEPVLLLGGGSNTLVADAGFDGTVVRIAAAGVEFQPPRGGVGGDGPSSVVAVVDAGADWDAFVAGAVERGLAGVECLSGIPGSVGATPIQNVGAYGQEVAQTVVGVDVLNRRTGAVLGLEPPQCAFSYRNSAFKGKDEYVVLRVSFELVRAVGTEQLSVPIRYAELARTLGVDVGTRAPLAEVRSAVLRLRQGKGMVLDPADHDTWSTGSFFTNPVLSPDAFAELRRRAAEVAGPDARLPEYPESDGRVKTSAAWLIERAGFPKGYGDGAARISTKHTLALTNRGGAKADDLLALAREVRDGVRARFGVTLVNEPVIVGAAL